MCLQTEACFLFSYFALLWQVHKDELPRLSLSSEWMWILPVPCPVPVPAAQFKAGGPAVDLLRFPSSEENSKEEPWLEREALSGWLLLRRGFLSCLCSFSVRETTSQCPSVEVPFRMNVNVVHLHFFLNLTLLDQFKTGAGDLFSQRTTFSLGQPSGATDWRWARPEAKVNFPFVWKTPWTCAGAKCLTAAPHCVKCFVLLEFLVVGLLVSTCCEWPTECNWIVENR